MNDAKSSPGQKIIRLEKEKGLTWKDIAERIGYAATWGPPPPVSARCR